VCRDSRDVPWSRLDAGDSARFGCPYALSGPEDAGGAPERGPLAAVAKRSGPPEHPAGGAPGDMRRGGTEFPPPAGLAEWPGTRAAPSRRPPGRDLTTRRSRRRRAGAGVREGWRPEPGLQPPLPVRTRGRLQRHKLGPFPPADLHGPLPPVGPTSRFAWEKRPRGQAQSDGRVPVLLPLRKRQLSRIRRPSRELASPGGPLWGIERRKDRSGGGQAHGGSLQPGAEAPASRRVQGRP